MKNYYEVLGLTPGSSAKQVKQAYRDLAKVYHPDVNNSPDAAQKFIEINEAYEVLMYHSNFNEKNIRPEDQEEYDEVIRKFRDEAKERARKKYEKYQKEFRDYQESGLYDFVLLVKYSWTIIYPLLGLTLFLFPSYIAYKYDEPFAILYLGFLSLFGGIIIYDVIQSRKNYFKKGKFYYNRQTLWNFLKGSKTETSEKCLYCKSRNANARPFSISVIHMKSIILDNQGPLRHQVGYNRTEEEVLFPRSAKAYKVHMLVSAVKILSISAFLIFFPITSLVWRFIMGIFFAWILSILILLLSGTKSKNGFLFSYAMIIKTSIWLTLISFLTKYQFKPFNLDTSEYLPVTAVIYLFFDSVLEQFLKMPKIGLYCPLIEPYKAFGNYFKGNKYLYLEIPFWTTFYPIFRWIF